MTKPHVSLSRQSSHAETSTMLRQNRLRIWLGVLLGAVACSMAVAATAPVTSARQSTFQSPEQAVDALVDANRNRELKTLLNILGPGTKSVLYSGDQVADDAGRAKFVATYDVSHRIEQQGPDKALLIIGEEKRHIPIPLIPE